MKKELSDKLIYTGYYAHTKKYVEAGLTTIGISGQVPPFYNGIRMRELAPSWSIFSPWKDGLINDFEYTDRFLTERLGVLDPKVIGNKILSYPNPILLCYEAQGKFCHRHLVADWLEQAGFRVEEYEVDKLK